MKREEAGANGGTESRALAALYVIAGSVSSGTSPEQVASGVLDVFASRLAMTRGAIVLPSPRTGSPVPLATRGMADEEWAGHFEKNRNEIRRLAPGDVLLLRRRGAPSVARAGTLPGGIPPREDIALFCAPVPRNGGRRPVIAADALFGEGVNPAEDVRLLTAGALLLASCLNRAQDQEGEGRDRSAPLGRVLLRHITEWIEPMDTTRRIARSDVYDRLIGEVEKILIAAAMRKMGYVQTEAARFLGMSRNTLARKLRQHGLGPGKKER